MIGENPEIASDYTLEDSVGRGLDPIFAMGSQRDVAIMTLSWLHEQAFRMMVLDAYSDNCTVCHLKHTELLDAAQIIADGEPHGEPVVPNGLSLCKIHHGAYDANIIGITPDYIIKVREDVLDEHDGPILKHGLSEGSRPHLDADGQELHGQQIILPKHRSDWPDRERLSTRYDEFRRTG